MEMINLMKIDFEGIIEDLSKKANQILEDNEGLRKLIENSKKKIQENQVFKDLLNDLKLSIDLISDWNKGIYKDFSKNSIIILIVGFIYLASPIDLIPDFLIGGFLDDAAVFAYIFKKIEHELEKYRQWKASEDDVIVMDEEVISDDDIFEDDSIFVDIN